MGKRKKLSKKRLALFIVLAIVSVSCIVVSLWLAVKYDKYGVKPYIIIPTVLIFFVMIGLFIYSLLNIYPYALNYDRKKLKKKNFIQKKLLKDYDVVKSRVYENFEKNGDKYIKIKKLCGLFGRIKYVVQFIDTDNIGLVIDKLDKNNKTGFNIKTKYDSNREAEIYFIETENITTEVESLENLLDMQYLDILKDPYKVIIPIIFEKATNKIYYYEKWSKLNITLLKKATKFVLKEILYDLI